MGNTGGVEVHCRVGEGVYGGNLQGFCAFLKFLYGIN